MEHPDRPVAIQVGGKTFACRLSTLFKYPDALLWKAYSFDTKHFDLTFWDRNPRVFACLLDFYRTNCLTLPSDVSLRAFKRTWRKLRMFPRFPDLVCCPCPYMGCDQNGAL